jgi:IS30 family transposase
MPAEPLSAPEREEIRVGIERAESNAEIARRLGRHRCTIGRELARSGGRWGYTASAAGARADECRARPKEPKLVADPLLAAHVEARLRARDSPMTISIELARGVHGITGRLSDGTIYAHGTRGLVKGLHTGLHRRRGCRKHRRAPGESPPKTSPLGSFNLMSVRPQAASGRDEVGHLEGDLIIGTRGASPIVTIFDRATRRLWLADLPEGHTAPATLAAVGEICDRIPAALRRTLTWDQEREMANHAQLAELNPPGFDGGSLVWVSQAALA